MKTCNTPIRYTSDDGKNFYPIYCNLPSKYTCVDNPTDQYKLLYKPYLCCKHSEVYRYWTHAGIRVLINE